MNCNTLRSEKKLVLWVEGATQSQQIFFNLLKNYKTDET
jgi:hypothetical protein